MLCYYVSGIHHVIMIFTRPSPRYFTASDDSYGGGLGTRLGKVLTLVPIMYMSYNTK